MKLKRKTYSKPHSLGIFFTHRGVENGFSISFSLQSFFFVWPHYELGIRANYLSHHAQTLLHIYTCNKKKLLIKTEMYRYIVGTHYIKFDIIISRIPLGLYK